MLGHLLTYLVTGSNDYGSPLGTDHQESLMGMQPCVAKLEFLLPGDSLLFIST